VGQVGSQNLDPRACNSGLHSPVPAIPIRPGTSSMDKRENVRRNESVYLAQCCLLVVITVLFWTIIASCGIRMQRILKCRPQQIISVDDDWWRYVTHTYDGIYCQLYAAHEAL